jgi:AcrR family transcriptional regulator
MSITVDAAAKTVPGLELFTRRPGRPRDLRAEQAILDATLELLVRDGITALSLSGVAARAGVGKATIYRWWSGKDDLVVDALATLADAQRIVPTGELRADLLAALTQVQQSMSHTVAGQVLPRVMGGASPEVQALYWERVVVPQRLDLMRLLQAGIDSGEIAVHDPEILIDMLVGPLIMRHCLATPRLPVGPDEIALIVEVVLDGLRPR